MPNYILLLHEPKDSHLFQMSPAEMQVIISKYSAWRNKMAADGTVQGGNKLQDGTGRSLVQNAGKLTITDGPYPETKEIIGGFFVVKADSFDHAVELSKTCPHLEFGRIEIRQTE